MAKFIPTKNSLALLAATAALLLAPGSMRARTQQPPARPFAREAQTAAAGWMGVSVDEVNAQKAQQLKLSGAYGVEVIKTRCG